MSAFDNIAIQVDEIVGSRKGKYFKVPLANPEGAGSIEEDVNHNLIKNTAKIIKRLQSQTVPGEELKTLEFLSHKNFFDNIYIHCKTVCENNPESNVWEECIKVLNFCLQHLKVAAATW
jgi:hypothetical protein